MVGDKVLVRYVGDDGKNADTGKPVGGRNLGRHGWVKNGQIITLTLEEWGLVLEDPETAENFELVQEKESKGKEK